MDDLGRLLQMIIRNRSWTTDFRSGGCDDSWRSSQIAHTAVVEVEIEIDEIDREWTADL